MRSITSNGLPQAFLNISEPRIPSYKPSYKAFPVEKVPLYLWNADRKQGVQNYEGVNNLHDTNTRGSST